jgi:hypothetical protein
MNAGTVLRTILVIATSLNTALMATDLTGFNNEQVDFWYKVASLVLNFIIVAIATYFNNDYTEEAIIGTTVTRQLKDDPEGVLGEDDIDDEDESDPFEGDESGDVEQE